MLDNFGHDDKMSQTAEDSAGGQPKNVKKIIKRVFLIAGYAILGIIFALAAWMCFDKYVLGSPAPRLFGKSGLIVITESMSGEIEKGDIVIIEKTDDYKIGDIITFLPKGDTTPTTHRIIGYTQDGGYKTKGDANRDNDPNPVYKDMILGEVVDVLPEAGLFFIWVKTDFGWVYIVGCIFVIALGIFVYRYLTDAERDMAEDEAASAPIEDAEAEEKDGMPSDGGDKDRSEG